jgi:hypothetical protein
MIRLTLMHDSTVHAHLLIKKELPPFSAMAMAVFSQNYGPFGLLHSMAGRTLASSLFRCMMQFRHSSIALLVGHVSATYLAKNNRSSLLIGSHAYLLGRLDLGELSSE